MPLSLPSTRYIAPFALLALLLSTLALADIIPTTANSLLSSSSSSSSSTRPSKRQEWSSIMGWVSIACWVLPSFSQMHQNYVSKSADGLSITFIVIWLAGDALNAAGALVQRLLWTMIILALYYCGCDCVLIFQYWYYSKYYHQGVPISTLSASVEANERTPLVADGAVVEDDLDQDTSKSESDGWKRELALYTLALALVIATGVAAWWIAERSQWDNDGSHHDKDHHGGKKEKSQWRWDAQAYGWASAILYLSSRFPQILKNRITKCEGLSLALFVFAVAGNVTYVASILLQSTEPEYLLESSSWLVGSLGTILLDFIVLGQFVAYRSARKEIHRLRRASISAAQSESR
ncbi:Vacuolar histidine transporter YPQ3 [Thecaphora frezii]